MIVRKMLEEQGVKGLKPGVPMDVKLVSETFASSLSITGVRPEIVFRVVTFEEVDIKVPKLVRITNLGAEPW